MKTIVRFVLVSALPLALAAPAFAEKGHGGELHAGFRAATNRSSGVGSIFTTSAGNFLPYSYYPYPDYSYVYPSPASARRKRRAAPAVSEEPPSSVKWRSRTESMCSRATV